MVCVCRVFVRWDFGDVFYEKEVFDNMKEKEMF